MKASLALRSARRLLRRSPLRTAIVIVAIAVPVALATVACLADWSGATGLTWSAVAVAVAVLLATQSSPEPTSVAERGAWQVAGASPSESRRPHRLAGLLVCWIGGVVGIAVGSVVGSVAYDHAEGWGGVLALGLALGFVGVIALVPSPRARRGGSTHPRSATRLMKLLGGCALVGAIAVAILMVGAVRSDTDALVAVPFAATVTILVVSIAFGPTLRGLLFASHSIPRLRPVAVAAARHRTPMTVRAVVVAAMVIAATAVLLGGSVGARSQRYDDATDELRRVPVVPPTVMAVTVPESGLPGVAPLPGRPLSSDLVAALRGEHPDADVIPVRWLVPTEQRPAILCLFERACARPLVVADARLARVYGQPAQPWRLTLPLDPSGLRPTLNANLPLSAPLEGDLVRRRVAGRPLPEATFAGLVLLEAGPELVRDLQLATEVRTVFVTRDAPFTAEERSAFRSLVAEHARSPISVITVDNRSRNLTNPLGEVPWAPTASSAQWSIAAIAALLALLVVVSTGTVDALDRRRDNERLELLGATPNQVRGAAALYSGLVLGTAAVLATLAVAALVRYGVERFSAGRGVLAVPFELPVAQIVFLVAVVPLVGAVSAAVTARETQQAPWSTARQPRLGPPIP